MLFYNIAIQVRATGASICIGDACREQIMILCTMLCSDASPSEATLLCIWQNRSNGWSFSNWHNPCVAAAAAALCVLACVLQSMQGYETPIKEDQ
jgi:hypothetical protein